MRKRSNTKPSPFDGTMYLRSVYSVQERIPAEDRFPFNLPFVRSLNLDLDRPVTFFVGENGTGKSTLLEAIADLCGLNVGGGGREDLLHAQAASTSELARALRPSFRHRPRDGFFFRAETLVNFATLLEERDRDPDFLLDPFTRYGGKSLHRRSHGEAFLDVFKHRVGDGLFLVDEPEAALSPQRQLALLYLMRERVEQGRTQFILATHSPILLTFPSAVIVGSTTGCWTMWRSTIPCTTRSPAGSWSGPSDTGSARKASDAWRVAPQCKHRVQLVLKRRDDEHVHRPLLRSVDRAARVRDPAELGFGFE